MTLQLFEKRSGQSQMLLACCMPHRHVFMFSFSYSPREERENVSGVDAWSGYEFVWSPCFFNSVRSLH